VRRFLPHLRARAPTYTTKATDAAVHASGAVRSAAAAAAPPAATTY
jgi:hypothetical protein